MKLVPWRNAALLESGEVWGREERLSWGSERVVCGVGMDGRVRTRMARGGVDSELDLTHGQERDVSPT